jgi:peptidoglycan hydrolase-like protein with peptidoglycan-binding domain
MRLAAVHGALEGKMVEILAKPRRQPRRGPLPFVAILSSSRVAFIALALSFTGAIGSAGAVGPSFPCTPAPIDALSRLTCSNDTLARSEIRMVQTYYTLRQLVGPDGQKPIKSEFLSFVVNTRRVCGLPPVEPTRDQSQFPLPANAANCVTASYDGQRTAWASRLSGPAAEEAARAPEQNIAVQGRLQSLDFLPKDATIDGVFGTGTRTALLAWQRAKNRPETGFFGNQDASILLAAAPSEPPDPLAKWRVKPLAQAEYHGNPVSLAYNNMSVSLNNDTVTDASVCAAGGINSAGDKDAISCRAIVAEISVDGAEVLTVVVGTLTDDSNIELFQIKAAVRTLDAAVALPQVIITAYSGGAHCCTSTTIATSGADGTWKSMTPPQIDGDVGYNFLDLTHDGSSVLVDAAEGFNYEFSSYAGSFSPTRIQKFNGRKLDDVTKDPRYRDFLLMQLRGMEASAAQSLSEQNGYLAGWVAQKTLVGQLDDGWRTMLSSYDRQSTNGRTACTLDKRVWVPGRYGSGLECPEGQEAMLQFPEALARHLLDLGYLTAAQSAQLGFDPVRIEAERQAATSRYEDQMLHGWFVITRAGTCMLSRTPVSPAAMVTGDRARGVEDDVAVLTSGDDGKPSVVRVGEPKGNGLLTAITFYRGVAKCESTRQQQKKDLEKLQ